MRIVDRENQISMSELQEMSTSRFGDFVKAVVDVQRGMMAVDAELHADEEALLLEGGSLQENLWGINLYPALGDNHFIEYDSMINLRPSVGNRSRGVDDPHLRERIETLVLGLVKK
jgi:hypothetical protein